MSKSFESLEVFELGLDLVVLVYESTRSFPKEEMFGLKAQMRRASISVISNVAEGQGSLTNGEWRKFLSHARASLFEVEAQSIAATRLKFLSAASHESLKKQIKRTAAALNNFIDFVIQSGKAPRRQPGNPATRQP